MVFKCSCLYSALSLSTLFCFILFSAVHMQIFAFRATIIQLRWSIDSAGWLPKRLDYSFGSERPVDKDIYEGSHWRIFEEKKTPCGCRVPFIAAAADSTLVELCRSIVRNGRTGEFNMGKTDMLGFRNVVDRSALWNKPRFFHRALSLFFSFFFFFWADQPQVV